MSDMRLTCLFIDNNQIKSLPYDIRLRRHEKFYCDSNPFNTMWVSLLSCFLFLFLVYLRHNLSTMLLNVVASAWFIQANTEAIEWRRSQRMRSRQRATSSESSTHSPFCVVGLRRMREVCWPGMGAEPWIILESTQQSPPLLTTLHIFL